LTVRREVKVTRRAAVDIRAAAAWWAENRSGAPAALREELARAFELLATHPEIGAVARNPRLAGIRRILLARVRYHLYYRVVTNPPAVEILALWHASRGSTPLL
jgi:plasmid stabilization system protein ParE